MKHRLKHVQTRISALLLAIAAVLSFASCREASNRSEESDSNNESYSETHETVASEDSESSLESESLSDKNFVMIPHFIGEPLSVAAERINEAGLLFAFEYIRSEFPENTVVDFIYTGSTTDSAYIVDRRCPLMLYVSKHNNRSPDNVKVTNDKVIYLTFDDGPGKYTESVLATLRKHNVKATFFTVGFCAAANPDILQKIIDDGHLLGCHTQTHDLSKVYKSPEAIVGDIKDWEKSVKSAIGYIPECKLFRFPGGSNNAYLPKENYPDFHNAVFDYGYSSYDWTFANNDRYLAAKEEDMSIPDYLKEMTKLTLSWTKSKPDEPKIMLMHDSSGETAEVLDWIITYLKEEGYTFSTLDMLSGDWTFRGR